MTKYHSQNKNIILYSQDEFAKMQKACDFTTAILDEITKYVKVGVSTEYLDNLVVRWIERNGAKSACLGYKGYPKTICTSINGVVCHGIPRNTAILKEGDIINIDITTIVDGWYGDSSRMYYVGKVQSFAKRLCEKTYESMMLAIETVRPGSTMGDIGSAIQKCVEPAGYSVVRGYCGHGIGEQFHRDPNVNHHFEPSSAKLLLEEGMIFTIEPMINLGKKETKTLDDGWTVITIDGKQSAQFEHTIGVTSDGYHIFTKSTIGFDKPVYDLSKLVENKRYDFSI
jgi:methionyl aminopeptidase